MTSAHGLLLAAGAGRRMGMPKALVRGTDGEAWLLRGLRVLRSGGCCGVTVVLGAAADEARKLFDDPDGGGGLDGLGGLGGTDGSAGAGRLRVVVAEDWAEGMGASLRAGLTAMAGSGATAVLVSLVDLPDVSGDVVRRVLTAGGDPDRAALRRASYDAKAGHPVLLGSDHWAGVIASARGDRGARDYLSAQPVALVECGDLATGADQDTPVDLPPDHRPPLRRPRGWS